MAYPKTEWFFNQCLKALTFDAETGTFFQTRTKNGQTYTEPAGRVTKQGLRLQVGTVELLAHHLAWRIKQGEWPRSHIKHADGDSLNNRLENLVGPAKYKIAKPTAVQFLKRLGITEAQLKRAQVDAVAKKHGARLALDLEHKLGLIDEETRFNRLINMEK